MLEPLGQSQVLAYLVRLAGGRRIHLISFEKAADWAKRHERKAIRKGSTNCAGCKAIAAKGSSVGEYRARVTRRGADLSR